ncbi:MAG: hypothetical protein NT099_04095 [Candidatus Saganbacteria bacterium]|nr:hypothetical protein [Candidatus Saganbacteria bacterium]
MSGFPGRVRGLMAFPADKAQAVRAAAWNGKTEITDYAHFCRELEGFLRNGNANFSFFHKLKVNRQGGFLLDLNGEAVPVFSFWAMRKFAGKEIFVSAEIKEGARFLTLSADGKTSFTVRAYNRELNRFYFRRQLEPEGSVTYILTVGPGNQAEFLGHPLAFNFEWKPGNIVLAQVKDGEVEAFVYRDRNEQFPMTAVVFKGGPKTLLVGNPITVEMLSKVSGELDKDLSVTRQVENGSYCFMLGGKEYYLNAAAFKGIANPLKAKIRVTLDGGKVVVVEVRNGFVKNQIDFVVVRDAKGDVYAVSDTKIFHRPKIETAIVEGHYSQVGSQKPRGGNREYFEEVDFFGAKARLRRLKAEEVDAFSPRRFSFVVYGGQIFWIQQTGKLTLTQMNMIKLHAFLLTEWQGRVIPDSGFYHDLLAQPLARDEEEERQWQIRFFSRIQKLLDGEGPPMLADTSYKQAAAFLFALEYMLTGKSTMPADVVEANVPKVLPLVVSLGEEKFAQAAAWLWRFPATQQTLVRVLPCLDIRDPDFGPQIIGAFNRDPFLWGQVFKRLAR